MGMIWISTLISFWLEKQPHNTRVEEWTAMYENSDVPETLGARTPCFILFGREEPCLHHRG